MISSFEKLEYINIYLFSSCLNLQWAAIGWTDEECKKVWQNCYKALPAGGKLVVCEAVLPELTDESQRTRTVLAADIFIMTMYHTKGKHMTEEQFRQLGSSAGFPYFRAFYIDAYMVVLEFQK